MKVDPTPPPPRLICILAPESGARSSDQRAWRTGFLREVYLRLECSQWQEDRMVAAVAAMQSFVRVQGKQDTGTAQVVVAEG